MYSCSTLTGATEPGVLAATAYKMTGRLGGNSSSRLPEAVTRPIEKPSGYLSLTSIGKTRPPKARMVTPDAPVKVVNMPQTKTTISAIPPGIQPRRLL